MGAIFFRFRYVKWPILSPLSSKVCKAFDQVKNNCNLNHQLIYIDTYCSVLTYCTHLKVKSIKLLIPSLLRWVNDTSNESADSHVTKGHRKHLKMKSALLDETMMKMFLSLDLLWEYRIQHGANGPLYVTSSYSTWIFCRGVSGFATDCPCGVWCRGLTTCLLHVGPPFGNRILNNSWAVGLT